MTTSGYISDRSCPTVPEHGDVIGIIDVGQHCPHHGHYFPVASKNIWTEDEFQAAKSATTSTAPATTTRKIKLEKPAKRRAKRRTKR